MCLLWKTGTQISILGKSILRQQEKGFYKEKDMIERYYNGVVEQVLGKLGKLENNYLLVRYSNDFSVAGLESVRRGKKRQDVFFSCHEFSHGEIAGGYEPFLEIICEMFRDGEEKRNQTFLEFMESCDVYYLHRSVLLSYFETGKCKREENVLLGEVEYEQERMTEGIMNMLLRLSEEKPIMLLLNRFQMAGRSSMLLLARLMKQKSNKIAIVIGINEEQSMPEFLLPVWDVIFEQLNDAGKVYHIGSARRKSISESGKKEHFKSEEELLTIRNLLELLDVEQAEYWLELLERQIKLDNFSIPEKTRYSLWKTYAQVSILSGNMAKALEICEDIRAIIIPGEETQILCSYYFLKATVYMYQGKLPEAAKLNQKGLELSTKMDEKEAVFQAELLEVQIQMSGWCNIFFCAQDITISEELLEKLMQKNYLNHLAHIYIYAYDNKPEMVANAYRSEALLIHFSRGIALAKQIGNEQLINSAYQKNIMLASTNGMYEISLLYSVRTYEALKNRESVECGRIFSGLGYNLCAMGQNEKAQKYYRKAIAIFYRLNRPEDIAEVQYNMSLNCIMQRKYHQAEKYLLQCMKAIEKLHLNSLRVCNLSKLYGLLALVSVFQQNRFDCERYQYNCRQFLNYIFEKEKADNDIGIIHDYAKSDDDLFLYTFSMALLAGLDGDFGQAQAHFEEAEGYLKRAEGNQFFCYELFRESRIACFEKIGKTQLMEQEKFTLEQYRCAKRECYDEARFEFLNVVEEDMAEEEQDIVTDEQLDTLLKQEAVTRAYKRKKAQLEFISTWQKMIDVTNGDAKELVHNIMKTFQNHFNMDRAVYVRYIDHKPCVLYNDTERELTDDMMKMIEKSLQRDTRGFVVSKIRSNYNEHLDVISLFGADDVCSMVAIPFFDNSRLDTVFITYVLMKDNWHSSVNHYMLDEDDLSIYQLLWREVRYSLNRLDAYDKIFEMNQKLYLSAVTDQLTGIFNREGFYRKITETVSGISKGMLENRLGIMFVDLDNFKHYNDTYGHDIGDLILKSMAELFEKLSRGRGFVCRYGGDEFIIVLYTDNKAVLEEIAQQIYQELDETNGFQKRLEEKLGQQIQPEEKQRISCSIGIVSSHQIQSETDINNMIKKADDFLYTIKSSTKGTYCI